MRYFLDVFDCIWYCDIRWRARCHTIPWDMTWGNGGIDHELRGVITPKGYITGESKVKTPKYAI